MFHWRSKNSNKKSDDKQRFHPIEKQTSLKWDETFEREFRSLDIDADGYISRADLQCVLR